MPSSRRQRLPTPKSAAFKVALGAFGAGLAWIIATSFLGWALFATGQQFFFAELVKSFLLVVLTATLLFLYVRRVLTTLEDSHEAEMQAKLDLVNRLALAAEYK